MAHETTIIPALPCASMQETLDFYVALGFEITYQQTRPNTYGCVAWGDINLHFFTLKGYEPANSYSTCLIITPDIQALHKIFTAGLRQKFGKVPVAGIPRITKPSNKNAAGDYRFNVVDTGGNWIRFIQLATPSAEPKLSQAVSNKLSRAILAADILVNAKGDFAAAAKMLDSALALNEPDVTPSQRVKALVLRAESAINLGESMLARDLLTEASSLLLTEEDREHLRDVLGQADDLAGMI